MKIGQLAKRSGLTAHTIRYYERIGLLPYADRDLSGQRDYDASILSWIEFLGRLKATGMPIREMLHYAGLREAGPVTEAERRELLEQHRERVRAQLAELSDCLLVLDAKIAGHPIAALQSEYSLWTRDPEGEILDTCRELGIGFVPFSPLGRGFVPFSPLGRGFLTGKIQKPEDLGEGDFRRGLPRFSEENMAANAQVVKLLEEMAAGKGATAAQLALAWVIGQGEDIVPIPGARRITHLEQNVAATGIKLSPDELKALGELLAAEKFSGKRYGDSGAWVAKR